jgi:hypothetical protein
MTKKHNISSSTPVHGYPNVTWFTIFEELEKQELNDMQIGGGHGLGGGLQCEKSYLIDP